MNATVGLPDSQEPAPDPSEDDTSPEEEVDEREVTEVIRLDQLK